MRCAVTVTGKYRRKWPGGADDFVSAADEELERERCRRQGTRYVGGSWCCYQHAETLERYGWVILSRAEIAWVRSLPSRDILNE